MLSWLKFILAIILTTWLGVVIAQNPGYIVVGLSTYSLEMPLWLGILSIVLLLVGMQLVCRIIGFILLIPHNIFTSWQRQNKFRYINEIRESVRALILGDWSSAKRLALKNVQRSKLTTINYLIAAIAAKEIDQKYSKYLYLASDRLGDTNLLHHLIAILDIDNIALKPADLKDVISTSKNHYIHYKYYKYLIKHNYWQELKALMPALRKARFIAASTKLELLRASFEVIIKNICLDSAGSLLVSLWNDLTSDEKRDPILVCSVVEGAITCHEHEFAEKVARQYLQKKWLDKLVELYAKIDYHLDKQIKTAEGWLAKGTNNPCLLLCLAELCQRNKLWGKAKDYIESSIGLKPSAKGYLLLAQILEQLNDHNGYMDCYRRGLICALSTRGAT